MVEVGVGDAAHAGQEALELAGPARAMTTRLRGSPGDDVKAVPMPDRPTPPNPEREANNAELRRLLEGGAIDQLPETYRTVFVLREVQGLSTAMTAECLGVSEEVVKTRLSRARVRLRDRLYERAGAVASAAFTFGAERCDRVVAAVLTRLVARPAGDAPVFLWTTADQGQSRDGVTHFPSGEPLRSLHESTTWRSSQRNAICCVLGAVNSQATWIEKSQFERLGSALGEGRATDIDRLLTEILASDGRKDSTPAACAVCRRDLVRCELGAPDLVASTCPTGHGAWLAFDALEALRRLVDAHAASVRARRRITVLGGVLAFSVAALAATWLLTDAPILPRSITARPIPLEEQRYLQQLMAVLEEGATNRTNVEGVLKAGDSERDTYRAVYDIYRGRAEHVIRRLRGLRAPERLQPAHERIVRAAERQMVFYGDFTEARIAGTPTDLARMLGHPAARESSYDLHTAWDEIRRLYPDRSPAELNPIEQRLCHFDLQ